MVGLQQTPIPSDDSLTTSSFGGLSSKASLQAKLSNYSDLKWAGSDKTICNPMLLPYDVHVGHPPMSQLTLKDCVIGAGDVSTAVQTSAISRLRPQSVSAAASNNCIKCESIDNQNETTKERKCLEATAQRPTRIEDRENVLDNVIKPDVDIKQEECNNYNSDYYAQRKTKKTINAANGDVHDVDIQNGLIGNPMLLPYDAHLRHLPMSRWTLKDSVIGTGDVYPAVQSSAISRLSYQRFSDHAMNNCTKYESIHKQSETTKERKSLEATVQVAVTVPMTLGDDTIVDVDIEKEKRKRYHREYYARRKKRKMSNVANDDVSHDIDKNKDFAVERRKEYNKEYYARQKKLREVNAKGNTESWQYPRINNSLHSAKKCAMRAVTLITNKTTSSDMGEFNTQETHVRADKAAQNTSCYSAELNTEEPHVRANEDAQKVLCDMGQLNTKETQASASDNASQRRKVYNRAYYLRNKENKIRAGVNKPEGCQTLSSTATTITVLNITGKERVTQVMFGLD
uniref:uncharacterized protein LOC122589268 n=1 Tax=Erigeron canadensis TaxID=72917 RepID=UPI001CB9CEC5|nr:uncharacterized protein LOC122589268 [Erigeron canadensis]